MPHPHPRWLLLSPGHLCHLVAWAAFKGILSSLKGVVRATPHFKPSFSAQQERGCRVLWEQKALLTPPASFSVERRMQPGLPSACAPPMCPPGASGHLPAQLTAVNMVGKYSVTVTYVAIPCGSVVKTPPASAGDLGLILGLGRSPGGGHGNPLLYSCLEDPMDGGAWRVQSVGSLRVGQV